MEEKEKKMITWEDIKPAIEELAKERNDEYVKRFNDARITAANVMVNDYLREHPNAKREEVIQMVDDHLNQSPDEFQRNLRIYVNSNGMLFNALQRINTDLNDFKEVFIAINQDKLEAWGRKQMRNMQKAEAEKAKNNENKDEQILQFKPQE